MLSAVVVAAVGCGENVEVRKMADINVVHPVAVAVVTQIGVHIGVIMAYVDGNRMLVV